MTLLRIVTVPKGTWKWQNAYRVRAYKPHTTRDGRIVWRAAYWASEKLSEPQMRRSCWNTLQRGGAQWEEITPSHTFEPGFCV